MTLKPAEAHILTAIAAGQTLKSHRDVDGGKIYQLHPLDPAAQPARVRPTAVEALVKRGLLGSNHKFPAATYLLTDNGRAVAEALTGTPSKPLTAKRFRI